FPEILYHLARQFPHRRLLLLAIRRKSSRRMVCFFLLKGMCSGRLSVLYSNRGELDQLVLRLRFFHKAYRRRLRAFQSSNQLIALTSTFLLSRSVCKEAGTPFRIR